MAIKNKRQSSTTASPAAPASLNYGEIATAGGGAISFRNNNPSSGKVSMKIDGVIYQNEGTNKVVDSSNFSYNGNLYINV